MGPGAKVTGSELARVLLADSLRGANSGLIWAWVNGHQTAPLCDNNINMKDNIFVKEALFQFISNIDRKLWSILLWLY